LGDLNPAKKPENRLKISAGLCCVYASGKRTQEKEKNGNWKNGLSYVPYSSDFDNKLKIKIKLRDGFRCCKCLGEHNLTIHHIDYNKQNNNTNNLITLCKRCNSLANADRDWWKIFYNNIINEKMEVKTIAPSGGINPKSEYILGCDLARIF
jgi:hypothetical protein